jgi:hypothetical protein
MPRAHHKQSYKFFGPFQVIARVGTVAYRLALPPSSKIHPVVHVSQLRLAVGFKGDTPATLPSSLPEFSIPVQILQTRGVTKGTRLVQQVLVEWSGLPRDLATWGQAGLQGPGNVTTSSPEQAQNPDQTQKSVCGIRKRRANVRVSGPE